METLDGLNDEQRRAVTTTEGFVRVIAGAGSGKTRALTHRFAYLVNDIGVLPENILCVTFTNKAASEMRSRIRSLTRDNDTGYIATFHGFCVSVLQEDCYAVSYPKSFLVLDNADINAMLQIIYDERGLTLRQKTFKDARDLIEMRKIFSEADYCKYLIAMSLDEIKQKYDDAESVNDIIFYGYLYQEKKCFALDYNDLLRFVLHIFRENAEIRAKWQQRLEYIMIDEFQDIDDIQYELMEMLCAYHQNLFIVGDSDQTIYSWRGANGKYLLNFDKQFPAVQTIVMNKNYRSLPPIITAANALISKNTARIEKALEAVRTAENASKPLFFHAKSSADEAAFIVQKIQSLLQNGVKLSDIAVLFRAHYISRAIEEALQKAGIAYTVTSGVPFFERTEIKDSLSYLRMIAFKDDLSFARIVNVPKRNIGTSRMEKLKAYSASHGCSLYNALKALSEESDFARTDAKAFIDLIEQFSAVQESQRISELFSAITEKSGLEKMLRTEGSQERLDNLAELKQAIYEYESTCGEELTLVHFLERIALFSADDALNTKNAVRLMTVHGAKGLEFPVVFIAGLNENMFPSKKTDSAEAMEEERRLMFVALTRARDELILSEAEGFTNEAAFRHPSRFIFDIGKEQLTFESEIPDELEKSALAYIGYRSAQLSRASELSALEVGARVRHGILGDGTVEAVDKNKKTLLIRFDAMQTSRKMSFRAPLTRI